MREFLLPSLGADMDAGTVVEWLVKEGDPVAKGDVIALVETEKGVIEVEIWEPGVVEEIIVAPGTKVAVGTPLARIGDAETQPGAKPQPTLDAQVEGAEPSREVVAPPLPSRPSTVTPPVRHLAHELGVDLAAVAPSGPEGRITRADVRAAAVVAAPPPAMARVTASPRARRVAADLGVDLTRVAGTGTGGAVTESDVRLAAGLRPAAQSTTGADATVTTPRPRSESAPPKEDATERQRLAMRRAIADVMAKSKREIPHYYLGTSIDLDATTRWLQAENERRSVPDRILPVVPLLKAAALAIREVPEMNGFYVDGEFEPSERIHLGVAISLRQGGLIAPAIHDADAMSLDELMVALRDLVARTRSGRLRSSEMSDPTITITNLGDRGVETVFPVIYAPQVAIVGFGKVTDRPRVVGGLLGIRPIVEATLAADHRVSDGHRGGRYLAAIEKLLSKPEEL